MHPAAMQQRSVKGLRPASSFSLVWSKSLRSIGHPLSDVLEGAFRRLPRRHGMVVNYGRSDPASADAPGGQERKLIVWRGLARFDFCVLLDGCNHLCCPFHVTGRSQANDAGVHARGFEREKMIERGDSINAAGRQLKAVCDVKKQIVFQIPE